MPWLSKSTRGVVGIGSPRIDTVAPHARLDGTDRPQPAPQSDSGAGCGDWDALSILRELYNVLLILNHLGSNLYSEALRA